MRGGFWLNDVVFGSEGVSKALLQDPMRAQAGYRREEEPGSLRAWRRRIDPGRFRCKRGKCSPAARTRRPRLSVLEISRVNDDRKQPPWHIDQGVPLAPREFLGSVQAPHSAGLGLDPLAEGVGRGSALGRVPHTGVPVHVVGYGCGATCLPDTIA